MNYNGEPQMGQLPAMSASIEGGLVLHFSPHDPKLIAGLWPLDSAYRTTIPESDIEYYESAKDLAHIWGAAGFQQASIRVVNNGVIRPVGVGAIHELPHAEIKVNIFDQTTFGADRLSIVCLAAHAYDRMHIESLQAEIPGHDEVMAKAYYGVGFRHRITNDEFDVVRFGTEGEKLGHLETWELRNPDYKQENDSPELTAALDDGWMVFQAMKKLLIKA